MKFGSREIVDVVFRAKSTQKIGSQVFLPGQPVLLIDTAKTSTLEGDSETTYATGGRGNSNLIAWDGSKTMTFTVEDALFSAIGISILMGADIAETTGAQKVHVHKMFRQGAEKITIKVNSMDSSGTEITAIDVSKYFSYSLVEGSNSSYSLNVNQEFCADAPLYVMITEQDGSITGQFIEQAGVKTYKKGKNDSAWTTVDTETTYSEGDELKQFIVIDSTLVKGEDESTSTLTAGDTYHIDGYVIRNAGGVKEIQVRKDKFAGYFYVEAETLYRRQDTGYDMPAVITIPKVKIQSNFSISMSADGDPSTATFTMDAFPDYTYFDKTKEVLCVIQIVDDNAVVTEEVKSVMLHSDSDSGATSNHPTFVDKTDTTNYIFHDSAITEKVTETGVEYKYAKEDGSEGSIMKEDNAGSGSSGD